MGRSAGERPEGRYPARLETERDRRQFRKAKTNESPGKTWAQSFAGEHDRKHAETDRQGPGIGRWSARDEGQGLLSKRAVARLDAEHRGGLQNENMTGDADEKSCRHRNGQKISDEAELEGAGANENEPDREAERRRSRCVMLRSRGGEHGQRAGENRRDGRICADRKAPAVAEQREPDRGGDEGEQTDLRREVGETSRRHLRGNGDRGQRQAGDDVGAEVARTPAGERAQNRPGTAGGRAGGLVGLLRHLMRAFNRRNIVDRPADAGPRAARNRVGSSLPSRIRIAQRSAWLAGGCRRGVGGPPRRAAARPRARASGRRLAIAAEEGPPGRADCRARRNNASGGRASAPGSELTSTNS